MFSKRSLAATCLLLASVAFTQEGMAQASSDQEKGFVSFAEFGGSASSENHVLRLNTSVGYNFSQHFGADFGVPFYFVGGSSTSSSGGKTSFSGTGIGAPYFNFRWTARNRSLSYAGSLTDTFPVGDSAKGLSTGHLTFDWNNHFEHTFDRVTPFGEIGIANTIADTSKFNRPYTSYGFNAHMEAGASVDLSDKFSVGASGYNIAPWGSQTIYSRSVPKNSNGLVGNGNSKQVFNQNSVTTGTSDLGKDYGFSFWGDYTPAPYVTAELGFTRSASFALNTVSFGLRFNLGYLMKSAQHN